MEILVNREPLDYTLENETSVGEVVDGVQKWLAEGEFTITSLDVNNTNYPIHDRAEWQAIELSRVATLQIEAVPLTSAHQTSGLALIEYLEMLEDAISNRDSAKLSELSEELPHVRPRVGVLIPGLSRDQAQDEILANEALTAGTLPGPAEAQTVLSHISDVKTLLFTRVKELAYPVRELAYSLGTLRSLAPKLAEVPVELQTGQETSAMQSIVKMTELLSRVYRLTPLAERASETEDIDFNKLKQIQKELAPQLAELQEAFQVEDSVLVGDLIEYEIVPRLGELDSVFTSIPESSEAE